MTRTATDRLILLTTGSQGADGLSTLSRQYIDALDTLSRLRGIPLEVWSLDDAGPTADTPADVLVRGLSGSRWRFVALALRASRVTSRSLIVVLHAHLLPVSLLLMARGARVVAVLVGVEAWGPFRPFVRMALRRAWRVLAISAATRDRFKAAHPECVDLPIAVCEPAVPPEFPASDGRAPGVPESGFALIVGRMSSRERYKGHDLLVDIWPDVRAAVPAAELVVVGTGDDLARLRAKAGDGIHFVGGLSGPDLARVYQQAAFFAMPSSGEGFGLVYLEAMRAGKACLAAPGAAEEILSDGETGLIVDPEDRAGMTAAVVRLFREHAWREGLGAAGRRTVSERFTQAQMTERLRTRLGLAAQE